MQRAYKVEIKPTRKQIQKINQSIGVCRWLYNEYLATNNKLLDISKNMEGVQIAKSLQGGNKTNIKADTKN